MAVLFLRPPSSSGVGRALASFPGRPEQLRAAAVVVGASLGPLERVFDDMEHDNVASVADLLATLRTYLVRLEKHRSAHEFSPEPFDPDDPACPKDDGENANAWYLFTRGRQLADDLASVLEYLEKLVGLGVENITIKAFP
jgi:hypothetical protein